MPLKKVTSNKILRSYCLIFLNLVFCKNDRIWRYFLSRHTHTKNNRFGKLSIKWYQIIEGYIEAFEEDVIEDNEGIFIENAISLSVLLVSLYPNHRMLPCLHTFLPPDNRISKKAIVNVTLLQALYCPWMPYLPYQHYFLFLSINTYSIIKSTCLTIQFAQKNLLNLVQRKSFSYNKFINYDRSSI